MRLIPWTLQSGSEQLRCRLVVYSMYAAVLVVLIISVTDGKRIGKVIAHGW